MGFLVRNGDADRPRIGVDWRAVAALGGFAVTLGTVAVLLLTERIAVLAHVAQGNAEMAEWITHKHNAGNLRHISVRQSERLLLMDYRLRSLQSDMTAIKRHLGIPIVRDADVEPPEEDD